MFGIGMRSRMYVVGTVAAIGLFGFAFARHESPAPGSGKAQSAVVSEPIGSDASCRESLAALTTRLRSGGFTPQAAKNNASATQSDCGARLASTEPASPPVASCTVRRSAIAADLRSQGFTAPAARNISWLEC
jgi:hypothetical protein